MGLRFTKRIKIMPGLSLNLGKKNISMSVGTRGAKFTTGTAGTRATVGIPGTGMFYSEKLNKKTQPSQQSNAPRYNSPGHVRFSDPELNYAVDCLRELPDEYQMSVIQEYEQRKKQTLIAYITWPLGLHYLYLMKPIALIIYWITGWGFGIWALIDLIRMPGLVKECNRKKLIKIVKESAFL